MLSISGHVRRAPEASVPAVRYSQPALSRNHNMVQKVAVRAANAFNLNKLSLRSHSNADHAV